MSSPVVSSPHRQISSLFSTVSYSQKQILDLFARADALEKTEFATSARRRVLAFLFFEPSTRTRMSFQMAAHRLGHDVVTFENMSLSSLTKGESLTDTVLNVAAMKPDALVIRYGQSPELDALLPTLEVPVINAGSGSTSHPTQALLDAFTIHKRFGSLHDKNVLIVGDIRHSRVASSNFDVLKKLGARVGVCGPDEFIPDEKLPTGTTRFDSLDEAITWCDVYMGLRIQLERHGATRFPEARVDILRDYHDTFGLTRERLNRLKNDAMIMHPGPINHGVEFPADDSAMSDSRNFVLEQVSNGVLIRAALLEQIFEQGAS